MKLKEIYDLAIKTGMGNDWRGRDCLDEILKTARENSIKPGFDKNRLFNPYGDTRIAYGNPETEIHSILVGIEIWPTEVLLAGQMRQMGKKVDLCLSHHTSCINRGLYYFWDIILTQKYALAEIGATRDEYDPIIESWMLGKEFKWKMDTINTARNLDVALMNIHTPCDMLHVKHTRKVFERLKDATLADIAEELNKVEEIQQHPLDEVIIHGDHTAKPGKVYNPVGAGWRPLIELFELACKAGINTAILISPTEEYFIMAKRHGANIIELPHDSNDNYGINLMLDELEKIDGALTVYEAHNFKRVTKYQRRNSAD